MATTRKKLSAAKARSAMDALFVVLDGTADDERLTADDRDTVRAARNLLGGLHARLALAELAVA